MARKRAWPIVGDCVMVLWEDVAGTGDWDDPDDTDLVPAYCVTIGWLLNSPDENTHLRSAATVADNGMVSDTIIIPIGNIHKVWIMQRGREASF